jgi:predicted metalloprotease with PDZ domain
VLAAFLREHERLLGTRDSREAPAVLRVMPGAVDTGALTLVAPGLGVLVLPAGADRGHLAAGMVRPLADLFQRRLEAGLAGAAGSETRWWREGFTEYTSLLAAVRSRALPEERFIARLLDAWLNVSRHSPLAQQTSLAAAGAMDGPEADAFVADGGLLTCFLLDVRLRRGSGFASGRGELLAATRGRDVDNDLLRREASRLARADLGPLLAAALDHPGPPPLAAEAVLAGLELAEAGTGEPFLGLDLEADTPVIAAIATAGPARARGLKVGDRILSIDGTPLAGPQDLDAILAQHRPGDPLEVSVRSEKGDTYTAVVELWERVVPALRRVARPSLAAANAWLNLTRGEATTFLN